MAKKIIDPQPVIDILAGRCLRAKGMESSIYGEVIDLLRSAPDVGSSSGFALIGGVHINTDQIRSFAWKDGDLCIWYAGRHFFESWQDPDRKIYQDLCYLLGVLPAEDPTKEK